MGRGKRQRPTPASTPTTRPDLPWSSRLRRLWFQNKIIFRSWAIFIAILAAYQWLLAVTRPRYWDLLNLWTAKLTAWSLEVFGATARVRGSTVINSVFTVDIIRDCTIVYPGGIFAASVLAYPCGWKPKLLGFVVGLPALVVVNQARLVALIFVGRSYPGHFEMAHMQVGQVVIIFATVVLWILWAVLFVRE